MNKILYIISGPPGIGKSTLARMIKDTCGGVYREADMFFLDDDGKYVWDPSKIKDAHAWCQQEISEWMAVEAETVIVANTFTAQWMVEPYLDMAQKFKYHVVRINMESPTMTHEDLAQRNIHGVPVETIARMRGRR